MTTSLPTRGRWRTFACALIALALTCPTVGAQAEPPTTRPTALTIKSLSLAQAEMAVEAAKKKADELHIHEDIAVVDAGAALQAFARMDTAWIGSVDIAIKKARTARLFNMETAALFKKAQPGQPLYMIEISNHGLIIFPGGVPIKSTDGHVIGAIGASGSSVENDQQVATAGAQAVEKSESQSGG